jgi:hypothetical protein
VRGAEPEVPEGEWTRDRRVAVRETALDRRLVFVEGIDGG